MASVLSPSLLDLIGKTPLVELTRLSPREGLETDVRPGATVILLPAMAGGFG